MTILVGRNAAGKSNFLDALGFVADSLTSSLDYALRTRGGLGAVTRKSPSNPGDISIELEFSLDRKLITYGFEISGEERGSFQVKKEKASILEDGNRIAFHREAGRLTVKPLRAGVPNPPMLEDRLYLVAMSGYPEFRPVFDALTAMGFYNLDPRRMRELVSPDAGELLHRDGSNIASVIARLEAKEPELLERICEYLGQIVPGIQGVERVTLGPSETIQFKQPLAGSPTPWRFYAANMSDGTLRVLGALVATSQLAQSHQPVRLIGIEEPETALHPAATGHLMNALGELGTAQIVLTTHSPDLLDHADFESGKASLLAVESIDGVTHLGRIDSAGVQAIQEKLFTAGELLRLDQLQPDSSDLKRQKELRFTF